ncbi:MAG: RNA methyltransferase [Saprospiraceae bacterium]|nr:RNA methyltransferase [Saprospiraceae bacterium]
MNLTPERLARITEVTKRRQIGLTIILENVHDTHNIGAVMRSCDAVGIHEIYVLYTEEHLTEERLTLGKRTSAGTRKWVDIHYFRDRQACFEAVRKTYPSVRCAMLSPDATSLYDLDLTQSTALLFGNERDGVSSESSAMADGDFYIPMAGMVQSLNISVACAVSLFEAYRQRDALGYYQENNPAPPEFQSNLLESYLSRQDISNYGKDISPKDDESPLK